MIPKDLKQFQPLDKNDIINIYGDPSALYLHYIMSYPDRTTILFLFFL